MGVHRFCSSVVQSFLCLQLLKKKRKNQTEIVSVTITFGYAELITFMADFCLLIENVNLPPSELR